MSEQKARKLSKVMDISRIIVSLVSVSGQINPLLSEHGPRNHLVYAFQRPSGSQEITN